MKSKIILKHILIGASAGAMLAACVYFLFSPLPTTPTINALLLGLVELIGIYKMIRGYTTGNAELKLSTASIESNPKMYNRIQEWWWAIIIFIPALALFEKFLQ